MAKIGESADNEILDFELLQVLETKYKSLIDDKCSYVIFLIDMGFGDFGLKYLITRTEEENNIINAIKQVKKHLSKQLNKEGYLDINSAKNVSCEQILQEYGIQVIRHKAKCPFHDDSSPSLSVKSDNNTWKCFGCGKGGDSISLYMELYLTDFVDAVKCLSS